MTLPINGPLSLEDINSEFGFGNALSAYRNRPYYVLPDPVVRLFPSVDLSIEDFYGTSVNGPGPSTNVRFQEIGLYNFIVPEYTSMTIEIWGAGGGGGATGGNLQSVTGGVGGSYVKYSVAYGALTPGSIELVFIGQGGGGGAGTGVGLAGVYSYFGGSIWAAGGKGGDSGGSSGFPATPYTPTNPRPSVFTLVTEEDGSPTGDRVWAGGVGGGGFFWTGAPPFAPPENNITNPSLSTLGGSGGAGAVSYNSAVVASSGSNPAGGGGGAAGFTGAAAGSGGDGGMYISWTT